MAPLLAVKIGAQVVSCGHLAVNYDIPDACQASFPIVSVLRRPLLFLVSSPIQEHR